MRSYAEEKGLFNKENKFHHNATHYEDEFDMKVDYGIREKVESEKNWIIESWLSGFMAQGVPGVLKVLMTCSSKAVRVDRIVNRDALTTDEALDHIDKRYKENLKKWQRVYAKEWKNWVVGKHGITTSDPIDFWRSELYDVVIDTYSTNQPEAVELVLDELKKKQTTIQKNQEEASCGGVCGSCPGC